LFHLLKIALVGGIGGPLFPTLKKGIIQLFIVSFPKVPEFWCSFFLKHKITNLRELLFYYRKKFKQLHLLFFYTF